MGGTGVKFAARSQANEMSFLHKSAGRVHFHLCNVLVVD